MMHEHGSFLHATDAFVILQMVQKCTASMLSARQHAAGMNSQLLLVISDGRGIFLEGTEVL